MQQDLWRASLRPAPPPRQAHPQAPGDGAGPHGFVGQSRRARRHRRTAPSPSMRERAWPRARRCRRAHRRSRRRAARVPCTPGYQAGRRAPSAWTAPPRSQCRSPRPSQQEVCVLLPCRGEGRAGCCRASDRDESRLLDEPHGALRRPASPRRARPAEGGVVSRAPRRGSRLRRAPSRGTESRPRRTGLSPRRCRGGECGSRVGLRCRRVQLLLDLWQTADEVP